MVKNKNKLDKLEKLREIINDSNNIVFFVGDGGSDEWGIKYFKGKDVRVRKSIVKML